VGTTETLQELATTVLQSNTNSSPDVVGYMFPRAGFTLDNYPNYGHWLCENLPQIFAFEHYQKKTGNKVTLLINENPPGWLTDTLQLMGYSSEDYIEWTGKYKLFDKVIMPRWYPASSSNTHFHPYGRRCVRDRMIEKSSDEVYDNNEYIFVTRENANRRQIINIEEVKNSLRPLGVNFYQPGTLSLDEEIRLFSEADVIIGPYGANLSGIMYSKNSTVIDIQPHGYFGAYYMVLANELDLEYGFINGENIETDGEKIDRNQDIMVNIDKLEKIVKEV
jgi:capsular polysaccharide biosynthesis protein